ncbi:MAG: hypothetical protein JJU16_11785 [Alkalibacterium sp.]|nr:hypothetical protein [Alkalibacterium sp.]
MKKQKKRLFLSGLLGVFTYIVIDGILIYLGIDVSQSVVSLLESVFG